MKLLAVSPGSWFSTADVFTGLYAGLKALDPEAEQYDLARQIILRDSWMRYVMTEGGQADQIPPLYGDHTLELHQTEYGPYLSALREEVLDQIVLAAIKSKPDWVLLISGYQFDDEHLELLSEHARTAMVFTESPFEDERQIRQAQLVHQAFTNDKNSLQRFKDAGIWWSEYLPTAYNPAVHAPKPELGGAGGHDVVFVGMGFPERVAYLEAIDWTGIDLGIYGDWRYLPDDSPIRRFVRQGIVSNYEATDLYQRSRVGLNLYRSVVDYWQDRGLRDEGYSLNPRAYELAACGVPQVSDWRPEVADVFDGAGRAFIDPHDAEAEIRRLLADEGERRTLAAAQRARVANHSYVDRARRLLEVLQNAEP